MNHIGKNTAEAKAGEAGGDEMSFARYLAKELRDNLTFFGPTTSSYSIRVNENQLDAFAEDWPMSKADGMGAFQAEFASNGDLLDYQCFIKTSLHNYEQERFNPAYSDLATECDTNFEDSGEASALINDMQCGAVLAGLVKTSHCKDLDQFVGDY